MADVGQQLRSERERRNLPRADVALATKIWIHHLAALEHGSLDELPDDGVVVEFVRVYAEYLGLDSKALVSEFLSERGIGEPAQVGQNREPDEAASPEESSEPVESAPPEEEFGSIEPAPTLESAGSIPPSSEAPMDAAASSPYAETEEPEPRVPIEEPREPDEPGSSEAGVETAGRPPLAGAARAAVSPARRVPLAILAVAASLVIAALLWWGLRGTPSSDRVASTATAPAVAMPELSPADDSGREAMPSPTDPADESAPSTDADRAPTAPVKVEAVAAAPGAGARTASLTVSEHGVGTAVVDHRLVGESNRFSVGDRVWFWTRVRGGSRGEKIRHVWLHEGRVIQSFRLTLGSSNWRTQSSKTLHAGTAGHWTVEARDRADNVLARSEFDCAR